MPIKKSPIAYLPPKVAFQDLHLSNGKLLTDYDIQLIKTYITQNGKHRYIEIPVPEFANSPATTIKKRLDFAVIVQDGKYYAVYHGNKANKKML